MKGKYFSFIGASHSGKSTLLKYINNHYNIITKEVSARKFLDFNKGSYDEQMNDELETKINFYYLQKTYENILLAERGENIITTRCVIDSLAYSYSLKSAQFLIPQLEEIINNIKNEIIILYTPCDFPMSDKEDKIRGMNEKIRHDTDIIFFNLLDKLDIPHYTISGNLENRKNLIDIIMKKHDIIKIK